MFCPPCPLAGGQSDIEGRHSRRSTQMMAVDTRTRTSFPSSRKTSHIRSCVLKEIAFANSVMYHFVANDDIVIKFFSCISHKLSRFSCLQGSYAHKGLGDVRHKKLD